MVYITDTVNPLGISGNHFLLVKRWLNSQGMQIVVGEREGGHTLEIINFTTLKIVRFSIMKQTKIPKNNDLLQKVWAIPPPP